MRDNATVPGIPEVVVRSHAERPIDPGDVIGLYSAEGWWPERSRPQLAAVLDAGPAVGAWAGDRLVGFARAVTDGVFRAYVEDVVLAPDARGAGVGQVLVDRLLRMLPPTAVTSRFCPSSLAGFYAGSGFRPTGQVVMHRRPDA